MNTLLTTLQSFQRFCENQLERVYKERLVKNHNLFEKLMRASSKFELYKSKIEQYKQFLDKELLAMDISKIIVCDDFNRSVYVTSVLIGDFIFLMDANHKTYVRKVAKKEDNCEIGCHFPSPKTLGEFATICEMIGLEVKLKEAIEI